jgi:hypothetical protein
MPSIGRRVHELRVDDGETKKTWRVIDLCRKRLGDYDRG